MELALPITVYWDLPGDADLIESLTGICDQIIDCRPLMVQLHDPAPHFGTRTQAILDKFMTGATAVTVTGTLDYLSSQERRSLPDLGIKEFLAEVMDIASLEGFNGAPAYGVSFSVTRENWRQLPDLITVCRKRGVNRLVLPMQRLYDGSEPFFLSREEQGVLACALESAGGISGMMLTIHDPFLWRAFNPGKPFPQGGCQAANTMIAIAPDGSVYPCPALPERLGNICTVRLREILGSPEKVKSRRRILTMPAACDGCAELVTCKGGCRGRSLQRSGNYDEIDIACR